MTVKEALVFLFLVLIVLVFFALGARRAAINDKIHTGGDTPSPQLESWRPEAEPISAQKRTTLTT